MSLRHAGFGREGDERLSEGKKAESRRPSADKIPSKTGSKSARRKGDAPGDVGRALRTAYDETLREDVPADFLDLLGKLS